MAIRRALIKLEAVASKVEGGGGTPINLKFKCARTRTTTTSGELRIFAKQKSRINRTAFFVWNQSQTIRRAKFASKINAAQLFRE